MTKKDALKDLEKNVYCRIKRSPIEGVGVFAIRDIPKGVNPFVGSGTTDYVPILLKDIENSKKIPKATEELVRSFFAVRNGTVWIPTHGLNRINISYFMNSSKRPNVRCRNDGDEFRAKRRIRKGEELTIDYREFSDE